MRRQTLGATQRIHTPAEFRQLLTTPLVSRTAHLGLYQALHEAPPARLGLVVAKRFAKRSVERNRIKRVVREAFRRYAAALPVGDYVVRLRQPFKADSARAQKLVLRDELGQLFARFIAPREEANL